MNLRLGRVSAVAVSAGAARASAAPASAAPVAVVVVVVAAVVAVALTVAGCGSSGAPRPPSSSASAASSAPAADLQVVATSTGASIAMSKGESVQVLLPASAHDADQAVAFAIQPPGTPVLVAAPGQSGVFIAGAAGTAKVVVTQSPICSPGVECPAHIVEVGAVTVTVTR